MSHSQRARVDLNREIDRLKNQVSYWQRRVAELEALHSVQLPILTLDFCGRPVKLFFVSDLPFISAIDVLAQLPGAPRPYRSARNGPQTTARLRRLGLGSRELNGLNLSDLAKAWHTTELHLCAALGISTKARWVGSVTRLGIESLRPHAPEFCAWVERDAFPALIERFGKGASS